MHCPARRACQRGLRLVNRTQAGGTGRLRVSVPDRASLKLAYPTVMIPQCGAWHWQWPVCTPADSDSECSEPPAPPVPVARRPVAATEWHGASSCHCQCPGQCPPGRGPLGGPTPSRGRLWPLRSLPCYWYSGYWHWHVGRIALATYSALPSSLNLKPEGSVQSREPERTEDEISIRLQCGKAAGPLPRMLAQSSALWER